MIIPIYELAMYEIVNKIREVCPSYYFSSDETGDQEKYNNLINELFEYTDDLDNKFPDIDSDTYCMVVCGVIMQTYVSELIFNSDFDQDYIDRLKSKFADDKTKSYFKHIDCAISSIRLFYYFNPDREIFEWPDEFYFKFSKTHMAEFHQELLAAINEDPSYSYAYCLISVPYFDSFSGVDFDFDTPNYKLREAFVKTHKYIGDELFGFLMNGNFLATQLTYNKSGLAKEEKEQLKFADAIASYAVSRGYDVERINEIEIRNGYYEIAGNRYPAGIPFFRHFDRDEFTEFVNEMFEYIPEEDEGGYSQITSPAVLTDQGDFRIEYKNYPLYGGISFFMPFYDSYPKETNDFVSKLSRDSLISTLLDASAVEMERLEEANTKLQEANEELKLTNESLNKHIKLNEELVRSLSHSSANYLNSDKLAQTGFELHTASEGSPTLDRLHIDGLLLLLQSEHETYLRRRMDSLVIRCSANGEELKRNIREGLSKDSGVGIIIPLEYSIKTIISRIVTREDDIRSNAIKRKFAKTEEEWDMLRDSFITSILANNNSVLQWCNENLCHVAYNISDIWQAIKVIEDRTFFDLMVEIITEQFLNALSHGAVNEPVNFEFGQSDEIKRKGKFIPTWCFVKCDNKIGDQYKGGKQTGIKTLNSTLMLINGNKRGIENYTENDSFVTKAWLEADLMRPLSGGEN